VQYLVTYEKIDPLGPLGGDGQITYEDIEAGDMVEATMKALEQANDCKRVRAVEGPPA